MSLFAQRDGRGAFTLLISSGQNIGEIIYLAPFPISLECFGRSLTTGCLFNVALTIAVMNGVVITSFMIIILYRLIMDYLATL